MTKYGVFMGRMNPIHLGHEQVIDRMIRECTQANTVIIIGSSNAQTSMRHFFSYKQRRDFVRRLYPTMRIMPAADFPNNDAEWAAALKDLLESAFGQGSLPEITFYGGADEDVQYYKKAGFKTKVINRFDGTTPIISATEVRDHLVHERPLNGLLNPKIHDDIHGLFQERWETFKNA